MIININRLAGLCIVYVFGYVEPQTGIVLPEKISNKYTISLGDQFIKIDPANGGRIESLNNGSVNFLTDSSVNDFNWGSTFWLSPQSDWNWPPSAEWDNQPYSITSAGGKLKMESAPDQRTGLTLTKIFSGNSVNQSYVLEYIITNTSDSVRKAAPWELTRVHTDGFVFFPSGMGSKRGGLLHMTKEVEGICWFLYEQEKIPSSGDTQIYADGGEGWFAAVNNGFILVKKFPDMPLENAAPLEGEIELYANKQLPAKSYVEIEQQGPYQDLKPGQSLSWKMTWFLRKLPENIKPVYGNGELIKYVRDLVK